MNLNDVEQKMQKALEQILEVAKARVNAKVDYTSGSMATDNQVYFRLAKEGLE